MSFGYPIPPRHHWRQEQKALLEIWRKMEQVQDLRQSRRRHAGHFSKLALATDLAALQHSIKSYRQRHQPRDARDAAMLRHTVGACVIDRRVSHAASTSRPQLRGDDAGAGW
jgi:hypothetical protein